ncbi:MAG TPA: WD40 repeat domain-containing protein [Ktedonobacterales bacterium]
MLKLGKRRPILRLQHEQVVESFVDYHFGRLSPEMNIAIERHVRSCQRCKREGLTNAANERKGTVRKLRGVRGGKPLLGRRARNIILVLLLLLAAQVLVYQAVNGKTAALISLLSNGHAGGSGLNDPQAPAVTLHSTNALPLITSGASAIALSSDDKRLAVAGGDSQRKVVIWDVSQDKALTTLLWSDSTPPTSIAWSEDGSRLAAADGSQLTVWDLTSGAVLWQLGVPSAPAMRVYDIDQQAIVARPDPSGAFSAGALAWGADGDLASAPAGALGPIDVSTPQAPVVGMWTSAGSHIFAADKATALVGASDADAKSGQVLLDWAPGGRYLLWGALSQPIAVGSAAASKIASQPPDSVVGKLASQIAQAGGSASAIVWFAPVGKRVAVCDQTTPGAHVSIVDIASGRAVYQLDETCDAMTTHAALWSSAGANFYIIPANGPVKVYTIPAA